MKTRNRAAIQAAKNDNELSDDGRIKCKRAKKIAKSVMRNERNKEDIVEMIGDGIEFESGNFLLQDLMEAPEIKIDDTLKEQISSSSSSEVSIRNIGFRHFHLRLLIFHFFHFFFIVLILIV